MTKRFLKNLYTRIVLLLLVMIVSVSAAAQTPIYRYTHIGNKHFRTEHTDEAEKCYLRVLKESPNNSRAKFNLANVYLTKGNIKVADSLYNHVAQTDVSKQVRAMAWHNRGYISQTAALKSRDQQQQLLQTAIEQYKQSLRLNPLDNRTRYNLALCQKQLKSLPPQQNKDKNKQEKNKQQEQKKQKQDKNQQQQNQNKQQDKQQQQNKQQTEQYMNLAKQAEQRALQKLKQRSPAKRSLDKNW